MSKKLNYVNVYEEGTDISYDISHCDPEAKTTLKLELELCKGVDGWSANIDFSKISLKPTITASAWKLAECFERMAEEIKKHEFDTVNFNQISK